MKLFREESVTHAMRRLDGDVMLDMGFGWRAVSIVLVAVVLGAAVFAASATYTRSERAVGWLVPEGGLIRATAPDAGIIDALFVGEGDVVPLGRDLVGVRRSVETEVGDNGDLLGQFTAAELEATDAGVEAEIDRLRISGDSLVQRKAALAAEYAEAVTGLDLLQQQERFEIAAVERARDLRERGFLSAQDMDRVEGQLLTARRALSTARSQVLTLRREITETDNQIRSIPLSIAEAQQRGRALIAEVEQKQTQFTSASRYRIPSPVAGRVLALPVNAGQSVPAGATLAVLAGTGQPLIAEIFVPARAAGFVEAGKQVSIQYQAYPYQKFGSGRGRVEGVSRTILAPSEASISGLGLQEPVLRVRVRLEQTSVSAYGRAMDLQPGMLLTANVIIDRRSLLEWLLDPLYAVGRRA